MPLSQSVARRLEVLILDGTLPPGKLMPSERRLSGQLGVSRPLVREAMKELRGRGIIRTQHGRGSFVAQMVSEVDPQSPLMNLFKDHPRTLYDLLEVREILESQAAYLAASRGTQADFYRLRKAFEEMESPSTTSDKPQADALRDHAFHHAIYYASHNPVLVHTLQSLSQLMLNSVMVSVTNLYHRPAARLQIDRDHRQLYNAIISRQPEWAQRVAANHIRSIYINLQEIEREEQRFIRAEIWHDQLKEAN